MQCNTFGIVCNICMQKALSIAPSIKIRNLRFKIFVHACKRISLQPFSYLIKGKRRALGHKQICNGFILIFKGSFIRKYVISLRKFHYFCIYFFTNIFVIFVKIECNPLGAPLRQIIIASLFSSLSFDSLFSFSLLFLRFCLEICKNSKS